MCMYGVHFLRVFCAALFFCLLLQPDKVFAAEDLEPPLYKAEEEQKKSFSTGSDFIDDAKLSGNIFYFQRKRVRYDLDKGRYTNNLDHATAQAGGEIISGFMGGVLGVDFGAFGAYDLYNEASPDHEMNFFPWRDPWHPDWNAKDADNGGSIYKAHLKAKAGPAWAKAGYFQPTGPGVLGVNWSLYPGTLQGAEAGVDYGGFSFAAAWADEYKAPWFKDTYRLRQNDGTTHVAWLWSTGARYTFSKGLLSGLVLEAAYGESENYLKNAHLKTKHSSKIGQDTLTLGYTLFAMDDSDDSGSVNDNFAGTAFQHFLHTKYEHKLWTFRLEFTYTQAPQDNANNVGYFAYRLISAYGGGNGAYDPWWDSRSDWNHNEEKAIYAGISRSLADLGLKGVTAGIGYTHGWDGRAYGYSERLNEKALTLDLGYTVPDGRFKDASIKAHYTEYRNSTSIPSWEGYKNAFQDERDVKLIVSIPFSL